jgi:hypothetical protein
VGGDVTTIPAAPPPPEPNGTLLLLLDEFKREVRTDLAGLAQRLDEKVVLKEVHELEIKAVKDDIARLRHLLNRGAAAFGGASLTALGAWLYNVLGQGHH